MNKVTGRQISSRLKRSIAEFRPSNRGLCHNARSRNQIPGLSHISTSFTSPLNDCYQEILLPCSVSSQAFISVRRFQSTSSGPRKFDDREQADIEITFEMDFMGEPVTFIGGSEAPSKPAGDKSPATTGDSLLAIDAHLFQLLSRGQALSEGGDEFGLSTKAAHSSAIVWADLIHHASFWCRYAKTDAGAGNLQIVCDAPMLVAAAFSPLLISGGAAYVSNLDDNYLRSSADQGSASKSASLPFLIMSKAAALRKNDEHLSPRERYHLWALDYLLQNEHDKAMDIYRQLLETCPGDALGLSLALDLSNILGERRSIFQVASSVAAYWNERGQRGSMIGKTEIEGHSIGSALIANGFAIGGRTREAEQLADKASFLDRSGASGVVKWAKAHIYHGEGRVSEGSSAFTGDGVEQYVSCGFLFFDTKMAGLGSRFVMDRDGSFADRKALRLYDENYGRILDYSGYGDDKALPIVRRIPASKRDILVKSTGDAVSSMFRGLFRSAKDDTNKKGQSMEDGEDDDDETYKNMIDPSESRSLEEIFTWLPPTLDTLTDATFLLLRLVTSGAIGADDDRWKKLKTAWEKMANIEQSYSDTDKVAANDTPFSYSPMARLAASFLVEFDNDETSEGFSTLTTSSKMQKAAFIMGRLLTTECDGGDKDNKKEWCDVVRLLHEARSGWEKESDTHCTENIILPPARPLVQDMEGWDLTWGNLTEHLICYAAVQSEDHGALNSARALCSESVILRANSPENWFRYGVILEKLGDEENAKDAFHASVSLGSGEGGRPGAQ